MIEYKLLMKIMDRGGEKGVLFFDIKERNNLLTNSQIKEMILGCTLRVTPGIGNLVPSNLEIQMNCGNMYHYVFVYSTKTGELISAQQRNCNGRWDPATVLSKLKAG